MIPTQAENIKKPNGINATGVNYTLTKNLEQNVKEIEEERKLLRALVKNSSTMCGEEKTKSYQYSTPDIAQPLLSTPTSIKQVSSSSSPRSCHPMRSCT